MKSNYILKTLQLHVVQNYSSYNSSSVCIIEHNPLTTVTFAKTFHAYHTRTHITLQKKTLPIILCIPKTQGSLIRV